MHVIITLYAYIIGVTVTVVGNPTGILVSGSTNTFDYPILSTIILICDVTQNHGLPFTVNSYQWNTTGCYTNNNYNDGVSECFPHGQTSQNVTAIDLTAEDSGIISCTIAIGSSNYVMTSESFTLRISG